MKSDQLAMMMLEWGRLTRELKTMESLIAAAVLETGKTQVVGNVRASYSGGRRAVDYKAACWTLGGDELLMSVYPSYAYQKTVVDYKGIAELSKINLEPFTVKSEPLVTLKLEAQ